MEKGGKKQQERRHKGLFLNLSYCCLETGLKLVLLFISEVLTFL